MATPLLVVAAVLILVGMFVDGLAGALVVGLILGLVGVILLVAERRGGV